MHVHRILIFINYSLNDRQLDIVILFVSPDIDMVCPAISSYSFGATALIFCMMFMQIMEVDQFIISYGQAGGIICVLQTHFIFFYITPNKATLSIIIQCGGILLFQFSSFFFITNQKSFLCDSQFHCISDINNVTELILNRVTVTYL